MQNDEDVFISSFPHQKGVSHVEHNFDHHPDYYFNRSYSKLAVQQGMGLLAFWNLRTNPYYHHYSRTSWTALALTFIRRGFIPSPMFTGLNRYWQRSTNRFKDTFYISSFLNCELKRDSFGVFKELFHVAYPNNCACYTRCI